MPVNRNTLLRYKTIDRQLRGGFQATLDELMREKGEGESKEKGGVFISLFLFLFCLCRFNSRLYLYESLF